MILIFSINILILILIGSISGGRLRVPSVPYGKAYNLLAAQVRIIRSTIEGWTTQELQDVQRQHHDYKVEYQNSQWAAHQVHRRCNSVNGATSYNSGEALWHAKELLPACACVYRSSRYTKRHADQLRHFAGSLLAVPRNVRRSGGRCRDSGQTRRCLSGF